MLGAEADAGGLGIEILLPKEEGELSSFVVRLLFASHKLAHVDEGLLCHAFNLGDAEDYSLVYSLRHFRAGKHVFMLQDSVYSDDAFATMIRTLDNSQVWKILYRRQIVGGRVIDSLCPGSWRMRRLGMWICSNLPMLKKIIFCQCKLRKSHNAIVFSRSVRRDH